MSLLSKERPLTTNTWFLVEYMKIFPKAALAFGLHERNEIPDNVDFRVTVIIMTSKTPHDIIVEK